MFARIHHTVELEDLVAYAFEALRSEEATRINVASPSSDAATKIESIDFLRRLWVEISDLPSRQRKALLPNLRDGNANVVARLFPLTGVASVEQVGGCAGSTSAGFSSTLDTVTA